MPPTTIVAPSALADLDVVHDPLALLEADERADLGRLVGRVADLDVPGRRREQLDDLLVDRALDEDPAAARSSPGRRCRRREYGDSRANFSRSASAKTMFGLLPPSSRLIFFTLPEASRMISWPVVVSPVKATLPIPGWAAIDAPAVPPGPVTTLRTPGRNAGLEGQLAEPDRRQRRVRRGLEDRGVAGRERRRDLPRGHEQREVPGHDQPDDADRLAQREVEAGLADRDRLAEDLVRGAGVVVEDEARADDLAARAR